jgi:WD40 repeat protein
VVTVLTGHENWVMDATFSRYGKRVATASWDTTARIWDVASEKSIAVLRGHSGVVATAAFSLNGARVVTASRDKTARV